MTVAVFLNIFLASVCVSIVLVHGELNLRHMEPRVVGGTIDKIKNHPHSVYLDATNENSEWHCGSSILNQKILLTAAHCVYDCNGDWSIRIFAGHAVIKKMKILREISRFVIHPKYDPVTFVHDLALLHMSKRMPFGSTIKRVIIRPRFPNVKNVQIAGWGAVQEIPETKATQLKVVKQKLMSRNDCWRAYKDFIGGIRTDGMLCAKNNINNRPSHGDSGGALMASDSTQIGLVSFRPQRTPEIIIYTNITYYYQWIKSNARRLYCN